MPKERQRGLAHRSHARVKVEVPFGTAWYLSAQDTMHVLLMKALPQLEFMLSQRAEDLRTRRTHH